MPAAITVNKRVQSAQRTRANLLDTGLTLAEQLGLERLSVNAIVDAAGVSKGTFFHHFQDRDSYLVALHRQFHDALFDKVTAALDGLPPGRARLEAGAGSYLDNCLRFRGVKALLLEARGLLPLQDEVLRRNESVVDIIEPDFTALLWPHPRAAARLWVAATAECALVELVRGEPDKAGRAVLARFTTP